MLYADGTIVAAAVANLYFFINYILYMLHHGDGHAISTTIEMSAFIHRESKNTPFFHQP